MNGLSLVSSPLLALIVCAAMACGGDPKGPRSPESNAGITETSAKEDMPPPPDTEGSGAAKTDEKSAEAAGAEGGMIKLAAIKFTPTKKGKDDKVIELKADGTVTIDGKPAAKFKGDEVTSVQGTSMVTVGVSGGLVGNGVKAGLKFEGDDVVDDSGVKLSVDDEGNITATKDAKSEVIGKAEGGAAAKRAALIVAVLWMSIPASPGDAPKPEKKPKKK